MFKLNESVYDEVIDQLEKNINKVASDNATKNEQKLVEALELLNKSAESLEQFGLIKEAEILTKLIIVAAKKKKAPKKSKKDPHTDGLTSEKMLHNLATKGIEFNADDQNLVHDHKLKYFPEEMYGEPVIYLEKGDTDYNAYCPKCAEKMQNQEGKHMLGHVYTDGPSRDCEKCGTLLESAMGPEIDPLEPKMDNNEVKDHKLKSFPESLHGIPVIYLEKGDQDYNAYCPKCAKELQDEGKNIHGHIYEEGPNRECNKCGKELESAMGQDAYYKENADEIDNQNHSHEGPDEYKREQLENGMDEYDGIMNDLDEHEAEDQVFI